MRAPVLAVLFVLAVLSAPLQAGPGDHYVSGQQLGAVLIQPGAANTATITVPANRILTIVAMQGRYVVVVTGTITAGDAAPIPVEIEVEANARTNYLSFALLGPATLKLSGEYLDDALLLTYALTRVRTVAP